MKNTGILAKTTIASTVVTIIGLNSLIAQKPNVIIFLADDLGYADIGCYCNKVIKTPNINRLFSEGVHFTSFYVNSAESTPTGAALLTAVTSSGPVGSNALSAQLMSEDMMKRYGWLIRVKEGLFHDPLGRSLQSLNVPSGLFYFVFISFESELSPALRQNKNPALRRDI